MRAYTDRNATIFRVCAVECMHTHTGTPRSLASARWNACIHTQERQDLQRLCGEMHAHTERASYALFWRSEGVAILTAMQGSSYGRTSWTGHPSHWQTRTAMLTAGIYSQRPTRTTTAVFIQLLHPSLFQVFIFCCHTAA